LSTNASNAVYLPAANYHGSDSFTYIANDGFVDSTQAVVSITVISVNDAPLVDAGPDQLISLPANTVTLVGTVSDDDFDGSFLLVQWSLHSGPASVSFSESGTNSNATVTFSTNGTYTLRLTADDGLLQDFDDVVVTVNAPP